MRACESQDPAAFDRLFAYYALSPAEIAHDVANGITCASEVVDRLKHEGGYRERQILETSLPAADPLVQFFTEKFQIRSASPEFTLLI